MGCVYYFSLTGHNAFEGESVTEIITSHIRHRVAPLHQRRSDLPSPFCDWVMKFIQFHPEHRWQSAGEALTALGRLPMLKTILIKSGPIAVPPEEAAKPPTGEVLTTKPASKMSASKISVISGAILLAALLVEIIVQQVRAPASKRTPPKAASKTVQTLPLPSKPSATRKASAPAAAKSAPAAVPPKEPIAKTTAVASKGTPVATKPVQAPGLPTTLPPRAGDEAVDLRITAPIIWAHEMAKVEGFIGREAAVRGRLNDMRSKGSELWIEFEDVDRSKPAVVFPLDKDRREEVLK